MFIVSDISTPRAYSSMIRLQIYPLLIEPFAYHSLLNSKSTCLYMYTSLSLYMAAEWRSWLTTYTSKHCPHRYPFVLLGGEKQLRLSVFLKDADTMANMCGIDRTRTHDPRI
eukprot:GHVU01088668.1.p1 GENE.GHVU01088668.1~~GHVU01088668.1.p1  ORF type:complete len:112 (-),score=0.37 GHVU01088668.1:160-495(-)